jgi:hypothetical protein
MSARVANVLRKINLQWDEGLRERAPTCGARYDLKVAVKMRQIKRRAAHLAPP